MNSKTCMEAENMRTKGHVKNFKLTVHVNVPSHEKTNSLYIQ